MIIVKNIKVNNYIYDQKSLLLPLDYVTISWQSESLIDGLKQTGYEIILSDNAVNWGTISFTGNKISMPMMSDRSTSYKIDTKFLSRGVTYYGQMRVRDSKGNVSSFYKFSFSINRLPTIINAYLTPTVPSIKDNLQLIYAVSADATLVKVRWFRNGIRLHQFDNFIEIPRDHLFYNDVWYAEITPYDGIEYGASTITSSVKLNKVVPIVKTAQILPNKPSINDILEADFLSLDGIDQSLLSVGNKISWYVNDQLIEKANDSKFIRFAFNTDDEVYFIVTPFDGIVYGEPKRSNSVFIRAQQFIVSKLSVDGLATNLTLRTLNPTISWDVEPIADRLPKFAQIKIGTVSGSNNIASAIVPYESRRWKIPNNLLKAGVDYFASVAVSDVADRFGDSTIAKFRVAGNSWETSVSNSTGWTLEFSVKLEDVTPEPPTDPDNPNPTPPPPLANQFFTFNIGDGSKQLFLRFTLNEIILLLGPNYKQSYQINNTIYNNFLIVGKENTIKVYANNILIFDATNLYTNRSDQRILQIGSDGNVEIKCYIKRLSYNIDGYYEIGSQVYSQIGMQKLIELHGNEITDMYVVGGNVIIAANPFADEESGKIYKINEASAAVRHKVQNLDRRKFELYDLSESPNSKLVQISHSEGTTTFKNYFVNKFDSNNDFTTGGNPSFGGWELVKTTSFDAVSFVSEGMVIDTTIGENQFAISQDPSEVFNTQNIEAISFVSLYNSVLTYDFDVQIADNNLTIYLHNQNDKVYETDLSGLKLSDLVSDLNKLDKAENYFFALYFNVYINNSSIASQSATRLLSTERLHLFPSATINGQFELNDPYTVNPYGTLATGKWYYTHRKKGTPWFDKVNNNKGWTVDFTARIEKIEDSSTPANTDEQKGVGIYFNDGSIHDTLWLLSQEVISNSQNKAFTIDATRMNDYRIVGKNDKVKIFAKEENSIQFRLLHEYAPKTKSSKQGNAGRPYLFADNLGNIHAVWHDDGADLNKRQLYYSYLSYLTTEWSEPFNILGDAVGASNPQIAVDSTGIIYVVYETARSDYTDISVVNKIGENWSTATLISTGIHNSINPQIVIDQKNNVHVVWEDYRSIQPQLYYAYRSSANGQWQTELNSKEVYQITKELYGAKNPAICENNGTIYLSYTAFDADSNTSIKLTTYEISTKTWYSQSLDGLGYLVSSINANRADNSDVVVNLKGQIFVVWREYINNSLQLFARIINDKLLYSQNIIQLTSGSFDSDHPSCGIDQIAGDVYVVFEKSQEQYADLSDPYIAVSSSSQSMLPSIFLIKYEAQEQKWYSSNQFAPDGYSPFDVKMLFTNSRICYRPRISKFITNDLHILFESTETSDQNIILSNSKLFTQIRDVVYNYNFLPFFDTTATTEYGGGELLLDGSNYRKEFRFGDFSDNTSSRIVINKIRYYLHDAVEPFAINLVSPVTTNLPNIVVYASSVNDFGDVWIGSHSGLYYHDAKSKRNFELTDKEYGIGKMPVTKIVFDNNGNMFIIADGKIKFSFDHNYFYTLTGLVPSAAIDIVFDSFANMYIISTQGLYILRLQKIYTLPQIKAGDVNTERNVEIVNTDLVGVYNVNNGMPTNNLRCIAIDEANIVWLGSDAGVIRFSFGAVAVFNEINGLSSNLVNDIAIRNNAIRYIATSKGLDRMLGLNIEPVDADSNDIRISTIEGDIFSDVKFPVFDKVKRVLWRNPNILMAATNNDIYQIVYIDASYQTELIDVNKFMPIDYAFYDDSIDDGSSVVRSDDLQNYRVLLDNNNISANAVFEVFLNGHRLTRGFTYNAELRYLRFSYPLFVTDEVEVFVRNDIELLANFEQNQASRIALGNKSTRLQKILQFENKIFAATSGDFNTVQINDDSSALPFDKIIMDRKPPVGKILLKERVENTIYRINIDPILFDIVTNDAVFDEISGIDKMIISNYPNFTSDGVNPLVPVNFSRSLLHNLGDTLTTVNKEFDIPSGKGRRLYRFIESSGNAVLYAGTASPANIYKYNFLLSTWELFATLEKINNVPNINSSVEFMIDFAGSLYVGVGNINGSAKVYRYNQISKQFELFRTIANASHAYCAIVFDNVLYIGAGGPNNGVGSITSYDGSFTRLFAENISNSIYSLVAVDKSLYAGTGREGRIYKFDIVNKTQSIVDLNTDRDCISIGAVDIGGENYVFAGFATSGIIKRSKAPDGAFSQSFKTIPSRVSFIKNINGTLHAAVGSTIYIYNSVWTAIHTHQEVVEDVLKIDDNLLYYISDNLIYKLDTNITTKRVYLKLIDKAGNETVLEKDGVLDENLYAELSLRDLQNIINTNKILRCDEFGKITSIRSGTQDFYSADFIDEEVGEYYSEIFNGANNFVSWDRISWEATIPLDTYMTVEIRTGRTRDDILAATFDFRVDGTEKSAGISFLSGQFIQFKITLRSRVVGLSPTVRRIVIRSVNTEAAHFFTTNFLLPSKLKSGILTSTSSLPVSAEIVFGINTNDSTDFTEYQLIDENRIFTADDKQIGKNLRVGIRLVSPSRFTPADYMPEYGPYEPDVSLNALEWNVVNNTSIPDVFQFRVLFYSDSARNNLLYTADTAESYVGFSINQDVFPTNGALLEKNESATIAYTPLGETPLRCNTTYYVKILSVTTSAEKIISDEIVFYQTCATTYVDTIAFEYVNTTNVPEVYHFRIKFFNNAERTDLKYTAFSGNDVANWYANEAQLSSYGATIDPNSSVNILYVPSSTNLTASKVYYLSIDVYDGLNFINVSNSLTFVINPIDEQIYCGDKMNVPVVKNFGLMFELENNEFINLKENK